MGTSPQRDPAGSTSLVCLEKDVDAGAGYGNGHRQLRDTPRGDDPSWRLSAAWGGR